MHLSYQAAREEKAVVGRFFGLRLTNMSFWVSEEQIGSVEERATIKTNRRDGFSLG
jgi:hypothetical protein